MPRKFAFDHPDAALRALAEKLAVTEVVECQTAEDSQGRVLAQKIVADRPSPAADVSAMDGYAIALTDLQANSEIPVSAESSAGSPPPDFVPGTAVRIFTGAIVPAGAEAVIKREDTQENPHGIELTPQAFGTRLGQHIRRIGENIQANETVLPAGLIVTAARRAAMANFGVNQPAVYAPAKVCIVTTGDEVGLFADQEPKPWQLRNSNQASLTACLSGIPWIDIIRVTHAKDDKGATAIVIQECLDEADAVILTGGVSMGDYDYVPDAVKSVGGETIFHGLPLRPGKPILGAATSSGKLILGLPGNPVSATIGCRRMALPLLAKISGQSTWLPTAAKVQLTSVGDDNTIPLHWLKLVTLNESGMATLVPAKGSGDLVALGRSDGFVHLQPNQSGEGWLDYFGW